MEENLLIGGGEQSVSLPVGSVALRDTLGALREPWG